MINKYRMSNKKGWSKFLYAFIKKDLAEGYTVPIIVDQLGEQDFIISVKNLENVIYLNRKKTQEIKENSKLASIQNQQSEEKKKITSKDYASLIATSGNMKKPFGT